MCVFVVEVDVVWLLVWMQKIEKLNKLNLSEKWVVCGWADIVPKNVTTSIAEFFQKIAEKTENLCEISDSESEIHYFYKVITEY